MESQGVESKSGSILHPACGTGKVAGPRPHCAAHTPERCLGDTPKRKVPAPTDECHGRSTVTSRGTGWGEKEVSREKV